MSAKDPQYESMNDQELRSHLREAQQVLIKTLRKEASRLDNVDDLESLSAALLENPDNEFDLSRYWGYDTRPDAPAALKHQVNTFEQIQGIYFERQAALALAEQEREKRRKGVILIGSIVGLIAIISAWVHFVPNRFSIDIREHNLKKLKFLSDFSTLAGQPMADLAGALTPPPPRFVQITRTYKRLAQAPPTSLYSGQLGVWQLLDDKGELAQLMLTGVPDRITLRRLYQALLPLLLRHPKAAQQTLLANGIVQLPAAIGAALLPTLHQLQRDTALLHFHQIPSQLQQEAQRRLAQIQTAPTTQSIQFADLLRQHNRSEATLLLPIHHPSSKGPLSFRLPRKTLEIPDTGPLLALLQAELAPWLAPPHKGTSPPPLAPRLTLPKALAGTFDQLMRPGLWDAALRGVPLPIVRYQQTFRAWSHEHRRPLWLALYQQMLAAGVSSQGLQGRRVLFRVQQEEKTLVIQPMWLLDLARDILEIHPQSPHLRWKQRQTQSPSNDATAQAPPQPTQSPHPPTSPANQAQGPLMGLFVMQYPKLHNNKGQQELFSIGHLFSNFEQMWRANVPVHPQFQKDPTPQQEKTSVFSRLGQEIKVAQKTLRTIAHQQRAASYLLELNDPKVGPLFEWMRRSPIKTDAQLHLTTQIRKRVGIISYHTPIRSGAWRIRMAHVLMRSSERRLRTLETRLFAYPANVAIPPPLRLLRARLRHEQGRYTQALRELGLAPTPSSPAATTMLAFYHPLLRFTALSGDTRGDLANTWSASFDHTQTNNNGTPLPPKLQLQAATRQQPRPLRPVLVLTGLPAQETQELLQQLNQQDAARHKTTKPPFSLPQPPLLSEQLLLRKLPIRAEIQALYKRLNTPKIHRLMALELAFGCHPPAATSIPISRPCRYHFFHPPTVLRFLPPLSVKGKP